MKKVKSISQFRYITQFGLIGSASVKQEFLFNCFEITRQHNEFPELYIEVDLSSIDCLKFGILTSSDATKHFAFNSLYFSNDEIIKLSNEFEFKTIKNPYYPDKLQGTLSFIHEDYKSINPIILKHNGLYYMLIYVSRRLRPARSAGEDMYGDDIYYIHGIWEVELSEEFKKKIYGENKN